MKDITKHPEAMQAVKTLKELGATPEQIGAALAALPEQHPPKRAEPHQCEEECCLPK